MKEAHIVFVTNEDDWEGVYVNSVLLDQGHRICKEFMIGELVGSVVKSVKTQLVDNEWLENEGGWLPDNLSDVVLGKLGD